MTDIFSIAHLQPVQSSLTLHFNVCTTAFQLSLCKAFIDLSFLDFSIG